ncbi:unnamed protein product [Arabidopsis thaliana]|uniref:(thale cress) hypothetical protein n=1 Tax=Arabidopsis thaliana TaxID=3702 RepID=A0A7G2FF34_ARATH|nr:unnamed protein product [Arabidopsis thaliana]
MFEEAESENSKASLHTRMQAQHLTPVQKKQDGVERKDGFEYRCCSDVNRNERAPDGLVVDAHLSDGFLHLILIKDCSRPKYLWHLTELAKRGGEPLNFEFVEYHKTRAFTFTSFGEESVWNLDGEIFEAHQLSAQVLRGLIPLFASGPEI